MGKIHRSVWKISIDLILGISYLRGGVLVYHLFWMWAPGWTNTWAQWLCFLLKSVFFFSQSGSSWESSREKVRATSAPLSVYKVHLHSVSSLSTLKVALRILRCVRTHTTSNFKAVSAMIYFFVIFICLCQSLCTQGGASSHYNLNYNDQVLHKPPSKWKVFGGALQHARWLK